MENSSMFWLSALLPCGHYKWIGGYHAYVRKDSDGSIHTFSLDRIKEVGMDSRYWCLHPDCRKGVFYPVDVVYSKDAEYVTATQLQLFPKVERGAKKICITQTN